MFSITLNIFYLKGKMYSGKFYIKIDALKYCDNYHNIHF